MCNEVIIRNAKLPDLCNFMEQMRWHLSHGQLKLILAVLHIRLLLRNPFIVLVSTGRQRHHQCHAREAASLYVLPL